MTLYLTTAVFSAALFLADTTGGLPPWANLVLTPTVIAGLFLTGQIVRGKDYEAAVKRAVESEARERETTRVAIPAIEAGAVATKRVMDYLEHKERR